MKLLFQDQIIEFEQTPSTDEVIERINEWLQDNFYFSHLLVDGEKISEDPEAFLVKNIADVTSVEIIAIAAAEFTNDLLLSAEEYTGRAVPYIKTLANDFYTNPSTTNWVDLSELFEGIEWLLTMIKTIDQTILRPSNWNDTQVNATALQKELVHLEEALENKDIILIADMLQYEILPIFEAFVADIRTAIDTEGVRHDLS